MSFNQSRSEKSGADSQYRKPGNRSGNAAASSYQRTHSSKTAAGGGVLPGSYQRTNSYTKSNNLQGGQSGGSAPWANPEVNNTGTPRNVQNGGSHQVPSQGVADAPIITASSTVTNAAPSAPNSNPAGLKSKQDVSVSSDSKPTQTPQKTEAGPPKGFSLQFGSISPGFVNGIQIPPRTSSAPPNLDEQRRDQLGSSRTAPTPAMPLPSIPKHQLPVKEPVVVKHPVADLKKESQVSSPSPSSPQKHSGIPVGSMSMHVPFRPPQGSVQIVVPPQFQPQMVQSASHQMPPILTQGNGPLLPPPIFVPPVHPHPMQHHGIMRPGQGINFLNQLRPQMPHQMSNMGINFGPQFTLPHAGKVDSPRRAIKITHPETREELRLDRQGDSKAVASPKAVIQNTVPPQTQPVLPVITPPISVPGSTQIVPNLQTATASYPINQDQQSTVSSNPSAATKNANSTHGHAERLVPESTHNVPIGSLSSKVDSITANVSNEVNQIESSNVKPLHSATVTTTATAGSNNSTGVDASVSVKGPTLTDTQSTPTFEVNVDEEEAVSGKLNVDENAAGKENSSIITEVEGRQAQLGLMESMKVRSLSASEKSETKTHDSKPHVKVLESNGSESFGEATTTNDVEALNSSKSGSSDTAPLELNRPNRGKKKIKEVLQKADAAGTTSDLYTAYKGPEEKDIALSNVSTGSGSNSVEVKEVPVDTKEGTLAGKSQILSKSEPDNWEDADDTASPKLKTVNKLKSDSSGSNRDSNEIKKYSKDFLMKFRDLCNTLPEGFNVPLELLRALLASNVRSTKVDRSASDRSLGTARSERRDNFQADDKTWSRGSASFSSRDQRADFSHGNNMGRPGSGGNSGVNRYPRGQAGSYSGGILPGPLQPSNSFHREHADGDRWHRARGGISSPQTPAQMIHKAEKKYEVGKVTDEEQAKQRQLKGILNKLTPQNFERLFEQVKAVNIDNAETLTGVISQIFDKALMEPTFCEMYADFCFHLAEVLPDFTEGEQKITFKRVLLNKCQEEFERGEREQEEANKAEEEGEVAQSNEEREEKRVKARRRMLGNIRLIGELYKKRMLTERIMHECIKKLFGPEQNADEEDLEALCKLMSTIGEMIDHPKARTHMDAYFNIMLGLSNDMKYSSRVRFMLKDSIDLRKNKWQQRRKVEGPKKIEDVHRDAAHERQAQSSRLARGPSMNASNRRGTSSDYGPRGSTNSQPGEYRNFPSQARGFGGTHDVRMEDRQPVYEGRNISVPLPQRVAGSDTVTLGPQGGLARGMSARGAPPAQITPTPGVNGYRTLNERAAYNSNDNALLRSASGRLVVSARSQQSGLERNSSLDQEMRSSGRNTDIPMAVDPVQPAQSLSVERLRQMSTSTIKEFYSAKDDKEVALCIKDMNTPSFYPSMVALWITDSFERKDVERNLLSKLLVSLTKAQDNILTHNDLLKGFESVLAALEDAVTDAPKAPEFLGRLFATVVMKNVIPATDIGEIVHKGGEEPGSLVETGLAGDVIGNILEVIQSEKGDGYLKEIHSSLRLEDFKPPHPSKSRKLEKFL